MFHHLLSAQTARLDDFEVTDGPVLILLTAPVLLGSGVRRQPSSKVTCPYWSRAGCLHTSGRFAPEAACRFAIRRMKNIIQVIQVIPGP